MTEVLERWRWYIVALLAVPMLVGVGVLLEGERDGPSPLMVELGGPEGRAPLCYDASGFRSCTTQS